MPNTRIILNRVEAIIAYFSGHHVSDIRLKDFLDDYIPARAALAFAGYINAAFPKVPTAILASVLFSEIKTVEQLIDYVEKFYSEFETDDDLIVSEDEIMERIQSLG